MTNPGSVAFKAYVLLKVTKAAYIFWLEIAMPKDPSTTPLITFVNYMGNILPLLATYRR